LVALGIIALGVAMIYGINQWRSAKEDRQARRKREQAIRENYRERQIKSLA
jgi:hypothetical protein